MNHVEWYTTEFLINLLLENLKNVNFDPETLEMETKSWVLICLPIVCIFTIAVFKKKTIVSLFGLFI